MANIITSEREEWEDLPIITSEQTEWGDLSIDFILMILEELNPEDRLYSSPSLSVMANGSFGFITRSPSSTVSL